MRKKTMTKAMSGTLAAATLCAAFAGLAGCGGKSSNEVRFYLSGTNSQMEMYFKLTDTFNETYGKENGIKVNAVEMLAGADITALLGSSNAPDVLMVSDDSYKKYVIGGYFADISDIKDTYTNIELGDIAPTAINRLYYNKETNTSNTTDPLYALPIDSCPTALYYNKGLMEKAGIIVISVDEKDLDKWNKGEIADNYGKKKSDYAKLNGVTVPKKGYYRSETPYYFTELSEGWVVPAEKEIMVFNNRIAMNWDEAEDLAMYFTAAYNPGENGRSKWGTTYGYFTETWFNYGWTVGGDCLYDLTGKGDWNFGLLDPNPNYIVKEGKTFTGRTGTVYSAGETIAFYDIYGKKFYFVLFFLPQVCSSVAVAMMWRWVFAENGVINAFRLVGDKQAIDFFTDANYYMLAIFVMSVWKNGTNIVILLSAFSAINKSLQEAARLDGADEMHVFWNVTFPQLTPTIFYLITMNLIASLQEQALFQLINTTATGPNFWGLTLTYQMYRLMNVNLQYGLSCAMSWFIGIFILIVTKINFALSKKWVSYD